jgi:hypothetical protein
MGSIITTVACCNGSIGENNVDEEVEDKLTVAEKISNSHPLDDDDSQSQIRMPVLHRSFSERTLPVN